MRAGEAGEVKETDEKLIVVKPKTLKLFLPLLPHHPLLPLLLKSFQLIFVPFGYGKRIQLSVFECHLTLKQMQQLYKKVKSQVVAREDNVRFYWLSSEAMSKVMTIGSTPPEAPPTYYVL